MRACITAVKALPLRWGGHWLEPAGVRVPTLTIPDEVWKIYPELSCAHDREAAIAATSFVPDDVLAELSDAYGLIGPAEQEVPAFRDHILPSLRAAGPVRSLV
jgi:hypothetical protein